MLERLRAEERLGAIEAALAANERVLSDEARTDFLSALQQRARAGKRKRERPTKEGLRAIGINVRYVPGPKKGGDV